MTTRRLTLLMLSGALAFGVGTGGPIAAAETADQQAPAPSTPPAELRIDPTGSVASARLAASRKIAVSLYAAQVPSVRVDVYVPRATARQLGLRVPKGRSRALLASRTVQVSEPGYLAAFPTFTPKVARRMARRPMQFTATIVATGGDLTATRPLRVTRRD